MDLFQNEILEEKNKNKKTLRWIGISSAIIVLLCIVIVVAIFYLQSSQLKIHLNGATANLADDTFIIEENGDIYISVSDIAKSLGYSYFKGEYRQASEEETQGYVQCENEVAMFEANSKKVYKTELEDKNKSSEYTYFYLDEPVRYINGKLYTTPEGIRIGFNTSFTYDKNKNEIAIFSLPYLVTFYTASMTNYGYKEIDETFNNQKAILSDMIVAKTENEKYGVISVEGKEIIGAKYDKIAYDEASGNFFVSSNNKNGLVDKNGKTKIALSYDEIKALDKDAGLYVVKNNNKYGVVNANGDTIVYIEYDKIGVDSSLYQNAEVKNPYLLFDNCIPVQRDKKWNLLDKKGKNILPAELQNLDGIGSVVGTSISSSASNLVIIPEYEAIVVMKNKKYGLVNSVGQELIACGLDNIYSKTSNGKTTYQMEYIGQILDVENYLESHGIKKVNLNKEVTESSSDINVTGEQNQTSMTNHTNEAASNNAGNEINAETGNTQR